MISKVMIGKFSQVVKSGSTIKYIIDEKTILNIDAFIDEDYAVDLDNENKIYILKRNDHDGRIKPSEQYKIELNRYYVLSVKQYDYSDIGAIQLMLLKYKARAIAKEQTKVKKKSFKR